MKSRAIAGLVLVFVLGFFACDKAFAIQSEADAGVTSMNKVFPQEWSLPQEIGPVKLALGLGATGDAVIDRDFDDGSNIDESVWVGGNIYWDPFERVHLDLFLGAAEMKLHNVPIDNNTSTRVVLDTDTAFSIGGGGKVDIVSFPVPLLTEWWPNMPQLDLWGSGGYRWADLSVDEVDGGVWNAQTFSLGIEISEWHGTLGISQKWKDPLGGLGITGFSLIPYFGVQYNDADLNVTGTSDLPNNNLVNSTNQSVTTGHRDSDESFGLVAGLQLLTWNDVIVITAEGRFLAEDSGTVSGHIRW